MGPFYSDIGRPSIDPELLIRKLCEEVRLHLASRWFCRLDLDDKVPHHSTFSVNRLNRFHESDIVRHIFERVVMAAMVMGLVKGEGFAVDGSVIEANASRYHGKAPTSSIGRGSSVRSGPPLAVCHSGPDRNRDGLARYGRAGDTLDRGRHRRRPTQRGAPRID